MNLETLLENLTDEVNTTPTTEIIEQFIQNPINLMDATPDSLTSIPGISYSTAFEILNLKGVKNFGYELIQEKLNLSDEVIYLLKLCTFIKKNTNISEAEKIKIVSRIRNKQNLNKIKGYEENKFIGSDLDFYQRYLIYYSYFQAGILLNKDGGERNIVEFYSGYISAGFENLKIILGDYYLKKGMGNILWNQFGFRKGSEVIYPASQFASKTNVYNSSLESNFFRGVVADYSLKINNGLNLILSGWYSSNNLSSSVDTSNNVTAISRTGLTRTVSEINNKNNLNEKIAGGSLDFNLEFFNLGIAALNINYDKNIISTAKNTFSGKSGNLFSIYTKIIINHIKINGELSFDAKGNPGLKTGILTGTKDYELVVNYRNFSNDFRSPFGYNFGESSYPANEWGIYSGLLWKGIKDINVSGYIDFFGSHGRLYQIPAIMKGFDSFFEIYWKIFKSTNLTGRIRYEKKTDSEKNQLTGRTEEILRARYDYRFDVMHDLIESINIRLRFDGNLVNFDGCKCTETGIATFAEITYEPIASTLIRLRTTYFNTISYNSAIWQFEGGLPGYFSIPPLYGDGFKILVSLKISLLSSLAISGRFSYLKKFNAENLGSGNDMIYGNEDRRLYLQIDFNL